MEIYSRRIGMDADSDKAAEHKFPQNNSIRRCSDFTRQHVKNGYGSTGPKVKKEKEYYGSSKIVQSRPGHGKG